MTIKSNTFYSLECNAKVDNYLYPQCRMVSADGLDMEAVVEAALAKGWTKVPKGHACPEHSQVGQPAEVTPIRRRKVKPETVEGEQP